jgi:hypothetical protein
MPSPYAIPPDVCNAPYYKEMKKLLFSLTIHPEDDFAGWPFRLMADD